MTFGERIIEELEFQGKTKAELARFLNTKQSTIQGWLEKGSMPAVDTALKIAKFLNTTVEYLVTGENPTHRKQSSPPALEVYNNNNKSGFTRQNIAPIIKGIEKAAEPLQLNDSADFQYIFDCYKKMNGHDRDTILNIVTALMSHYPITEEQAE